MGREWFDDNGMQRTACLVAWRWGGRDGLDKYFRGDDRFIRELARDWPFLLSFFLLPENEPALTFSQASEIVGAMFG